MNVALMTGLLVISLLASSVASAQAQIPQDPFEMEEANMTTPYDPWEAVNQPVFTFNLKLDEYVFRPVATGYDTLMPDAGQRSIDRFFKNLGVLPRFTNSLFQGKLGGASREVGRFAVNTTLGGVGLFDVADDMFGWKPSDEDFGQTLATYGMSSGPYLMLPFFGPSTLRDTLGFAVDSTMNPMNYLLSTIQSIAIQGGLTLGNAINLRSMNLDLFQDVDRFSLDLYGAVQDGYLQRRTQAIAE